MKRQWMFYAPEEGAGGGGGETTPPPARRKAEPLTFTQEEFDRVIAARLDHERRKIEAQLGGPNAIEELETLRKEREERARKEQEAKGNYDRALQSVQEKHRTAEQKWQEERSTLHAQLRTDRVRARLVAAAAAREAIDPAIVADLLDKRVRLDEAFNVVVLDEQGNPAFDGGTPRSIDALVEQWEKAHPYLFKSAGTGGAGSRGGASISAEGHTPSATRDILAAREALDAARVKAQASGQPADITAVQQAARRLRLLESQQRSA